jgi:hypothetical protein
MSTDPRQLSSDAFAHALIAAGKADLPGPDVHAAWSRFTQVAGAVAFSAESVSGVHPVESGSAAPNATSPPAFPPAPALAPALSSTSASALKVLAVKWSFAGLMLGSLGASAALLTTGYHLPRVDQTPPELDAVEAEAAPSLSGTGAASPAGTTISVFTSAPTATAGVPQVNLARNRTSSRAAPAKPDSSAGTALSEEVRLVDGARRALRAADPALALQWIRRYRTSFSAGSLKAEADYLEAQARNALGQQPELQRRSQEW